MDQPTPPARRQRVSPIIPAYLGLWEAREVFVPDADGHLRVDTTPPDPEWSDSDLLPYGQRIEFTDGYDAKSNVSFLIMYLRPPFAPDALQYKILRFHYSEQNGVPQVRQEAISHEYDLSISKDEAEDYKPVGGTAESVIYSASAGIEWGCEFYVTKDRQRMWSIVLITEVMPSTTRKRGFQLYHRLAEFKRHSSK